MQGTVQIAARHHRHVVRKALLVEASGPLSLPPRCRYTRSILLFRSTHTAVSSHSLEPCKALHEIKEHSLKQPLTIFESKSDNVYHNLAIENFLLRNSDPNSRILFFYTNAPCLVIGRNQNPWIEVNLPLIQEGVRWNTEHMGDENAPPDKKKAIILLDLVRRRSGGGTVIHDWGNLNFSVIVPNDKDFTRNKHAEMVVSGLQSFGATGRLDRERRFDTVRVNERHDIVMKRRLGPLDDPEKDKEWKVSGSAYKLIRGRAMHHGTLLHSSPNVRGSEKLTRQSSVFQRLLTSPAKSYIEAKGVESVSSPVHNLWIPSSQADRNVLLSGLMEHIGKAFRDMYNSKEVPEASKVEVVSDMDCLKSNNPTIAADIDELKTDAWRFEQTPSFEFNSHTPTMMQIRVNKGIIEDVKMYRRTLQTELKKILEGKKLHEVSGDWYRVLGEMGTYTEMEVDLERLEKALPAIWPYNAKSRIEATRKRGVDERAFL